MRKLTLAMVLVCALSPLAAAGRLDVEPDEYPWWRGPVGSGASLDSNSELVESWEEATFVWASEQRGPMPNNFRKNALRPRKLVGNGGFGCPIVSGGRVYVAAFEPNIPGKKFDTSTKPTVSEIRRARSANDLLFCLREDTGELLWKASFPYGKNVSREGSGHYVCCVYRGKVYWVGTKGVMYCVDARTGRKAWHRNLSGVKGERVRWRKAQVDRQVDDPNETELASIRRRQGLQGSRGWGWDSPVIPAGSVVVTNTNDGEFVAVDANSGEVRWALAGVTSVTRAPAVWWHEGKAYVIGINHAMTCIEAETGKIVWVSDLATRRAYAGYTPPIDGDILVALGADNSDEDPRERTNAGWAGFRLTLEGPKRLWMLGKTARAVYESPVIYRGHVWFVMREPRRLDDEDKAYLRSVAPDVFTEKRFEHWWKDNTRGLIAAVDVETGEFSSVIDAGGLGCSSIIAGDGRLMFMEGNSLAMIDADPENPRHLGYVYPGNLYCVTPVYAGGKLYVRGAEYLVNCWDLRKHPPAPEADADVDLKNAKFTIDLSCGRINDDRLSMAFIRGGNAPPPEGEDLRLHVRTRDGEVVQSWVTYGPDHNTPDWTFPDGLKVKKGRLVGKVRIEALGRTYPMELDMDIEGNKVRGRWEDTFTGEKVKGSLAGTSKAIADGTGKVMFRIRREWCGGQNKHFETTLTFEMKDGQAVADTAKIEAKVPSASWQAEVTKLEAVQKGRSLTGSFTVDLKSNNLVKSGTYRVDFDTTVICNIPEGSYRSYYEGKEITPRSKVNRMVWGKFEPPADAKVDPANALHEFTLRDALPGKRDVDIFVELRDGKPSFVKANTPRFNRSDHTVDFGDLKLEDGELTGIVEVIIRTDGFVPAHDTPCEYDVKLRVEDNKIRGSYDGMYEKRESRSGFAEGTVSASRSKVEK